LSNGHRSGWDPQEPRRSSEDSNGQLHRQQQQQQPGKQEGLQQQHSLGRTSSETSQHHHHHRDVTTPGSGEAQTATCGLNWAVAVVPNACACCVCCGRACLRHVTLA
jgi:hypothetical protein